MRYIFITFIILTLLFMGMLWERETKEISVRLHNSDSSIIPICDGDIKEQAIREGKGLIFACVVK